MRFVSESAGTSIIGDAASASTSNGDTSAARSVTSSALGPPRRRARVGPSRGIGARRADRLAEQMGARLGELRAQQDMTQTELAAQCGLSQGEISRLESGFGAGASLGTWSVVAAGLGTELNAYLAMAAHGDRPRDYQHLRRQQLVALAASAGGWAVTIERRLMDGSRAVFVDVFLERAPRNEIAIVEIWDWFDDLGAALRGHASKIAAAQSAWPSWAVSGCLVVRGTRRNRVLLHEFGPLVSLAAPASARRWLGALQQPDVAMPFAPALLWTDVAGTRLIAARPSALTPRQSLGMPSPS